VESDEYLSPPKGDDEIRKIKSSVSRKLTFNECEIIARFIINDALHTVESG